MLMLEAGHALYRRLPDGTWPTRRYSMVTAAVEVDGGALALVSGHGAAPFDAQGNLIPWYAGGATARNEVLVGQRLPGVPGLPSRALYGTTVHAAIWNMVDVAVAFFPNARVDPHHPSVGNNHQPLAWMPDDAVPWVTHVTHWSQRYWEPRHSRIVEQAPVTFPRFHGLVSRHSAVWRCPGLGRRGDSGGLVVVQWGLPGARRACGLYVGNRGDDGLVLPFNSALRDALGPYWSRFFS